MVDPDVPAATARGWLENRFGDQVAVRKTVLYHLPMFRTPYTYGGRTYQAAVDAILKTLPKDRQKDDAVVLMGHGTHHPSNAFYAALMFQLQLEDPNIFWEYPAIITHGRGNHAVRTENWRYIRYETGEEELYDHRLDPNEWKNLANNPGYHSIINELKEWIPKDAK